MARKDGRATESTEFVSSTTKQVKFTWSDAELEAGMNARMAVLFNLLKEKYPEEDISIILLVTHPLQKSIAQAINRIPELELFIVSGTDLQKQPWVPNDGRMKILIPWEPGTSIEYWIDQGWIDSSWYVYAIAKDLAIREKIKTTCNFLELWSSAEDGSGIKFPGCTEYHLMSYEQVKDADNEYTFTKGGCKCGVQGLTFTVQTSSQKQQ